MRHLSFSTLMLCIGIVLTVPRTTFSAGKILDEKIPAGKTATRFITIEKWGRYSLIAQSQEGSALQLIDRKAGLRRREGVPGEKNGRIDEFLDLGDYKLIVSPHPDGKTETVLKVVPFVELNSDAPQYVTPEKEYEVQLHDFEQASYWIYCEHDTTLLIEAIGRNVADVQLWLNGEWRIDAQRCAIDASPAPETPLKGYRVVQKVKAGYYLFTVYGGESLEWAKKSDRHPAYIRAGLPRLPGTGYSTVTISKKGCNNYFVKGALQAVILEREKPKLTQLSVMEYPMNQPSARVIARDSVHAKLIEPRCLVHCGYSSGNGFMVQVAGKPGDTVNIQTFESVMSRVTVPSDGTYWISTFTSGYSDDLIGSTGLFVNSTDNDRIMNEMVEVVSDKASISRSFNLVDDVSLIFKAGADGKYDFIPGRKGIRFSVSRLIAGSNKNLGSFDEKATVMLLEGYYLLSISPIEKGVASFKVHKSGVVQVLKAAVGSGRGPEHGYRAVQFPHVTLDKSRMYTLYVNSLQPELTGTVLRRLPLKLDDALPVYLDSAQEISLPVWVNEKARLTVTDGIGKTYTCKVNGRQCKTPCDIDRDDTVITLSANRNVLLSVMTIPVVKLPGAAPRPFPTGEESPLPNFPKLAAGKTAWFDLKRNDYAVYEFTVPKAGMYRFETLGRLKMSLTLRDRFVVNALSAQENGTGRNAMILTYLLAGTYQAQAATLGRSTGHLGLSLVPDETIDGGKLTTEKERKHELHAGEGIAYSVDIPEKGVYDIVSEGQSGFYSVRFDDAGGWPVVKPFSTGNISTELEPGTYHLYSMPQERTTLRTARMTKKEFAKACKGKGPHRLNINAPASGVWMEESDSSGVRLPVTFAISVPAPAEFRLSVTGGFTATLLRKGSTDTVCIWKGTKNAKLQAGEMICRLVADEVRNEADYTIGITTGILMKGLAYKASGNGRTFEVSVGSPGVYEFFSQGTSDVTATLLKGKKTIDINDDAPFDWNFRITRMLMPGSYTLKVGHATSGTVSTVVKMSALDDSIHTDWTYDTPQRVDLGGKMHRIIIPVAAEKNMLHVAVRGASPASCQIQYLKDDGSEVACGNAQGNEIGLSVPVLGGKKYALYLWSADHADENVTVTILTATANEVTIDALRKGEKFETVADGNGYFVWLKMDMRDDSLGQFVVEGDDIVGVKTAHTIHSACKQDMKDGFVTLRQYRWAAIAFSRAGKKKITIDHCNLEEPRRFPLEKYPRAFRIPEKKQQLTVMTASVKTGRPMSGIRSGAQGSGIIHPHGITAYAGIESGTGKTMSVNLPGDSRIFLVWDAVSESGISEKPDMEITAAPFALKKEPALVYGQHVWNAPAGGACSIDYVKGSAALVTVTIPRGGIALWRRSDGSRILQTTDQVVKRCEFQEASGTLYLVNTGTEAQFTVDCIALDAVREQPVFRTVESGLRYEAYYTAAGINTILIPPGRPTGGLHVSYSGAVTGADWWSGEGNVVPSIDQDAALAGTHEGTSSTGGSFTVRHTAGWVKIDLYKKGTDGLWGDAYAARADAAAISFSQALMLRERINWFAVTTESMTHLRMQADVPMVITILHEGTPLKTFTAFGRTDISVPVVKGLYSIGCRGLGETSLQNVQMIFTLTPMTELTQRDPPHLLMAAGESRMFHIAISQKTKAGLGLETGNEVIAATLYDSKMNEVARGQQQFCDLDKGDYYLHLAVDRDDAPTGCTIRLIGQDVPPDGPPESVVNRIMGKPETGSSSEVLEERFGTVQQRYDNEENYETGENPEMSDDESEYGEGYEGDEESETGDNSETTDENYEEE